MKDMETTFEKPGSKGGKYYGPSEKIYDIAKGERIDPEQEGIGMTGQHASPNAVVNGETKYRRIFIRLRTPEEILTYSPIEDGEDFAERVKHIISWYDNFVKKHDVILEFAAIPARELDETTSKEPLFTLTAEEVEIVRQSLLTEKNVIIDIHVKYPAVDAYIIPARDKINNLLNRIKEWQDDNESKMKGQ